MKTDSQHVLSQFATLVVSIQQYNVSLRLAMSELTFGLSALSSRESLPPILAG